MTATGAALSTRLARVVVGRGAIAYPRQAMIWAAAVLALAVAALLLLARPWAADRPAAASASTAGSAAGITERLSRSALGPGGTEVTLVWATPEYLRITHQTAAAARFDPAHNFVFFQLEHKHTGNLGKPLRPVLRMPGMTMAPVREATTLDSSHHRFTVLVYRRMGAPELVLPPPRPGTRPAVLSWPLRAAAAVPVDGAGVRFTWATLLALFGGLLSSMWPCLFQLSVYFVPTLAGISARRPGSESTALEEASSARLRIVKTAGAFVLGFVIVYTAAGAAAGFAAASLDTSILWTVRRPLSIAAGVVILILAVRLAANGRAPLVCKMPIGNFLGRKNVGYLGTMLLGLAFAIGCTTCFGAAIVLAMVTYVGVAASPLSGALIMFVFALGMAIPLLVGAAAMARVLSVLGRMEKVAPYMVLGAAAIMAGFAVLLLSGHAMQLSNVVARGAGG